MNRIRTTPVVAGDGDVERCPCGGGSGRRAVSEDDWREADCFEFAAAFAGGEDVLALLPAGASRSHFLSFGERPVPASYGS